MSNPINPLGLYPDPQQGLPIVQSQALGIVLKHWLDIRRDRSIPLRSDIDPTAIYQAMPAIWIYQYDDDHDDFRCELSGDAINTAWKRNITGALTRELFQPNIAKTLTTRWQYLIDRALVMKTDFNMARDLSFKPAERLTLPLTNEDGSARCIIGVTEYAYKKFYEDQKDVAPPDSNPHYFDCLTGP
ncbi:PAS domain-containing protein [Aestuariispira insulae]|uniref:PAS domain-containing protein n=1 Tax=Aestuariispira insulae TaxID=1461337 RepID=A0A3D9HI47_9PROT|nr:PAS domain-containing protein [Aestuariispira insulae]RED49212.1 hypothetical protein DFP90_106190 [Aestuariispira insulae]